MANKRFNLIAVPFSDREEGVSSKVANYFSILKKKFLKWRSGWGKRKGTKTTLSSSSMALNTL